MQRCLPFALFVGLCAAQDLPHVVLTSLAAGSPRAQILDVDLALATATPLPRFPADVLPPLAITVDPFDRDLVVAFDLGTGNSRVVRLQRAGTTLVQHPMFDVPGRITALAIGGDFVFAASDGGGGLWRAARRGGQPALAYAQANLTALHGLGHTGDAALLGWTGRPGTPAPDSGVVLVDPRTGQVHLGPHTFANPNLRELTGAVDLPTGVPRQLLAFDDGSYALFAGLIGPPAPVVTTPPIPVGGAAALAPASLFGVAPMGLGGASFPFLYEVDFWSGVVTVRSQALPGDPVDFCAGGDRSARSLPISDRCGPVALHQSWSGTPQPGSVFSVGVLATPGLGVFLAAGLADFPGLPVPLPGGCGFDVRPDAVSFLVVPNIGQANVAIAVPAGPAFVGTIVFAQWLHAGAAISVSGAAAHQIGW